MKIVSENRFSGKTYFYTIASRASPASDLTEGHNACYCKFGIGTRKVVTGLTSGGVECASK